MILVIARNWALTYNLTVMKFKTILPIIILLGIIGFADASYLTYEHYSDAIVPCSTNPWVDCGKVLDSRWSEISGIPLSMFGIFYYASILIASLSSYKIKSDKPKLALVLLTTMGAGASIYFVFLQLVVIKAICTYCMLSALTSFTLLALIYTSLRQQVIYLISLKLGAIYYYMIKPLLFVIDPHAVHNTASSLGEMFGKLKPVNQLLKKLLNPHYPSLQQELAGIEFETPVGLAAGYDYQAKVTQIGRLFGFGLQTVGTITATPFPGNPKPHYTRLPKSKAIQINKGFQNPGIKAINKKLKPLSFDLPLGLSLGQVNNPNQTLDQAISSIAQAFDQAESAKLNINYYELNISCPNLKSKINFSEQKSLEKLLRALDITKLSKPVFVKMPINLPDEDYLKLLKLIHNFNCAGVIVGNLQKNKLDPSIDQAELSANMSGGISGLPTQKQSNHLIKLSYQHYQDKLIIIGCGGIFNAEDAYVKIKNGANLLQLITGLIYQGPMLVHQINYQLDQKLKADGYTHISQAVGADVR